VGPTSGLDAVANTKSTCPSWESNLDRPARSLVTIWTANLNLNFSSFTFDEMCQNVGRSQKEKSEGWRRQK
jgi:hypothetical protein